MLGEHFFWTTSRAAGIAALLASSLAVSIGLLMGGRMVARRGLTLRALHEALALATLIALGVHAFALLGDGYLKPSLADVTLPFASSYERVWMTVGIVGGWLMAILGLSYYLRGRIGAARWRRLHRFTALAWLLGVVHAFGMGSDAGASWFLLATGAVALPAAALLVIRIGGASTTAAPAAQR